MEYAEFLVSRDRRQKIDNPAGFIIYAIENQVPVPTSFVTRRKLREREATTHEHEMSQAREIELQLRYDAWVEQRVEAELRHRYIAPVLKKVLKDIVEQRVLSDDRFSNMTRQHQEAIAMQFLRREIKEDLQLLSFTAWCQELHQQPLF